MIAEPILKYVVHFALKVKHSHITLLICGAALFFGASLPLGAKSQARPVSTEHAVKSFDIQRYPNQPLELIELKISEQEIQHQIASKSILNGVLLDTVAFKGSNRWFTQAFFRFRNVCDRPIYGVTAYFYFKSSDPSTVYSLPLTASTTLKEGVVYPGGEVVLTVTDKAWKLTADILKRQSVDADVASVKFVIDILRFSDNLLWKKGQIFERDADNPAKWNVTNRVS